MRLCCPPIQQRRGRAPPGITGAYSRTDWYVPLQVCGAAELPEQIDWKSWLARRRGCRKARVTGASSGAVQLAFQGSRFRAGLLDSCWRTRRSEEQRQLRYYSALAAVGRGGPLGIPWLRYLKDKGQTRRSAVGAVGGSKGPALWSAIPGPDRQGRAFAGTSFQKAIGTRDQTPGAGGMRRYVPSARALTRGLSLLASSTAVTGRLQTRRGEGDPSRRGRTSSVAQRACMISSASEGGRGARVEQA